MPATVGQPAPDFKLKDQNNQDVSLDSLKGHKALVVFIPNPFTGLCDGEACALRDDAADLDKLDAKVVVITTFPRPANAQWSKELGIQFPVLSDFWPHGAIAQQYGAFHEGVGVALRASYVLDKDGLVREIIQSEGLPHIREHAAYARALANIG